MEVKLYQIEVNHHLMSHRWRCCPLLSTAPPSCLPPMVVTKGISIAVMWCEVQLVHYTLIFVTCYNCYVAAAVLYTVIISGLYFAIIESCHNRCFISDVSSQYVTVTECDTSRTISYLALSIVRMSIVHTNMFHHRTFHPPFIRPLFSLMSPHPAAGSMRRGRESWDPHIRCSRHRAGLNISSLFLTLSCSPASLCAI